MVIGPASVVRGRNTKWLVNMVINMSQLVGFDVTGGKFHPPCLEPELFWVENGPSGRRRANSECFWVLCARGCKNTMPVTSDL